MVKESIGQRGKLAEKAVEKVLKAWNAKSQFAYHRLPDARAARGRLSASPADFLYFLGSRGGFIEVKSTEHSYRLAKDKVSQLPTLHKFSLAGAVSCVIVLHTEINQWRCIPSNDLDFGVPSWDLRAYKLHPDAESALTAGLW